VTIETPIADANSPILKSMVISIHRVFDGRKSPKVIRFGYHSYYFLSAAVSPEWPLLGQGPVMALSRSIQ
jgi:hypothetical protein